MEIKIPKEVRAHKETIFFGLSARQFICAVLAVAVAVAIVRAMRPVPFVAVLAATAAAPPRARRARKT